MESIQLSVTGMKCGGCVSTVEKILNNSDGIENVSVNLLTESAYFEITQKHIEIESVLENLKDCLLYTSPSPRDSTLSRMPSSA